MIKRLRAQILAMITRVQVDKSADGSKVPEVQIVRYGKASVVEQFQPQGLYFRAPPSAEGLLLNAGGSSSSAVLLDAQDRDTWPAGGNIEDGTGGLHYLGDWKVFLDADGVLHLGTKTGESLISRDDKIQEELARVKSELDAIKSAFDAHIHTTTATVGSGPAVGVISAPTSSLPAPADPGPTAAKNVKTT